MNRLRALIPIGILAALIVVFYFVIPAWRDRSENSANQPPANDLPPVPRAKIEGELEHHFGTIELHGRQTLTHTFTLRNADDRELKLVIDGTSCECVAGELAQDTLAPGETIDVNVSLLIGKPGEVVQKVYLNASGALITLKVTAIVKERVEPVIKG